MLYDALADLFRQAVGDSLITAGPFLLSFGTMFLSVLLGALPFILVAVLASGFVEMFVSQETLARLLPRHPVLGVLVAPLLGFFIPLCECAIIPIAGRLVRKGVPLGVGITFMLANPILNPVPMYATAMAFPFHPELVVLRMTAGYVFAVLIGLLVLALVRGNQLRGIPLTQYADSADGAESPAGDERQVYRRAARSYHRRQRLGSALAAGSASPGSGAATPFKAEGAGIQAAPGLMDPAAMGLPLGRRIRMALEHAGVEFFVVGKFFIIGAFLASLVQALISRNTLAALGQGEVGSVAAMMAFAYLLNICSEADAFVAAGFTATFSMGSLLAFLTLGPMTDIKNTMIMFATFKRSFAILLNILIILTVFGGGVLVNRWLY